MARGVPANPEKRTCPVCGNEFAAMRKAQLTCSFKLTGRRCQYTAQARALRARNRVAAYPGLDLTIRTCQRCRGEFQPWRVDQVMCGKAGCLRPDEVRFCANETCPIPDREFVVTGSPGHGRGNQSYCSKRCRDQAGRRRWETRFRKYGMTREQYATKVEAQDGRCLICDRVPQPHAKHPGLVADHDHVSGKNRDLLCANCNAGLGYFGDNPAVLRAAASYLERWQEALSSLADRAG